MFPNIHVWFLGITITALIQSRLFTSHFYFLILSVAWIVASAFTPSRRIFSSYVKLKHSLMFPTTTLWSSSPWMNTYSAAFEKSCQRSPYRQHHSLLWNIIRYESTGCLSEDIRTSALLANSILSQCSMEEAVIDNLSNQLDTPFFPSTQLRSLFNDVLSSNRTIATALAMDLVATALHEDSLPSLMSVLLFHKGFHALAAYRVANALQAHGRHGLARHFQSIISRVFAADIHPSCYVGPGCYFASGCDVVIGETASIGRNCVFMHGITLGGNGKESGDRHPKVGNHVFVGAHSTLLGNIRIEDGSIINPCSVVTKPVPINSRVGGVPARVISNASTPYLEEKVQLMNKMLQPVDCSEGEVELYVKLMSELNCLSKTISLLTY